MGYRTKRLQDFARGVRESRALGERERWPRERLERFQDERLAELAGTPPRAHRSGASGFRVAGWS